MKNSAYKERKKFKMNQCDICLDEKCKKNNTETHKCNCETCIHIQECYKFLHPTIRLTTKCTQECEHCCFRCSPDSKRMMSIDTAKQIAKFLKNNDIISLNVMGGEFYCNKNWYEILSMFLDVNCHIRLVSNGDWGDNTTIKNKLQKLYQNYPDQLHISLSYDDYHTNQHTDSAIEFLTTNQFPHNVGQTSEKGEDGLVPIGRSDGACSFYGLFGCYCHNPQHEYSFLIDEDGDIYKCAFGVWNYANITEYQSGGFAKKFKEFNQKFYNIFITSCSACIRSARKNNHIVEN